MTNMRWDVKVTLSKQSSLSVRDYLYQVISAFSNRFSFVNMCNEMRARGAPRAGLLSNYVPSRNSNTPGRKWE